jgi:hypothetical protein
VGQFNYRRSGIPEPLRWWKFTRSGKNRAGIHLEVIMKKVSEAELLEIAKNMYQTNDIEINHRSDTNEMFAGDDADDRSDGTWVRAWVYVPGYKVKDDEP